MATCIEVAKKAGVSRQTVSRVINNSPNVTEETRRKVLQAIEELSYHPNMLARALKSAKSHSIGFIISDPLNPFFIKVASSLQVKLSKQNYNLVLLFGHESILDEEQFFHYMYEQQVDLILFTPSTYNSKLEETIRAHQTPVIQLFRSLYDNLNSITINDRHGTYLATADLLKNGHKKIVLLEPSYEFDTGRVSGFKDALAEYGVPYEDWMYLDLPSAPEESESVLIERLNKYQPTAIIPVSKSVETLTLTTLDARNIKLYEQMSLVFYDDNEIADLLKITAIGHDIDAITDSIISHLFTYLDDPQITFRDTIEPELLRRGSIRKL
jgi:DNA-binding LacI/PurR family transcriptional regulator